jgi:hypothetical protein
MDNQRHWLARILKRGYQHVFALRRDGAVWVVVQPTFSFIDVDLIRNDLTPWQLFPGFAIQHVTVMRRAQWDIGEFTLGPLTCVTLMKALLGIRAWHIVTPHQLFKRCTQIHRSKSWHSVEI